MPWYEKIESLKNGGSWGPILLENVWVRKGFSHVIHNEIDTILFLLEADKNVTHMFFSCSSGINMALSHNLNICLNPLEAIGDDLTILIFFIKN